MLRTFLVSTRRQRRFLWPPNSNGRKDHVDSRIVVPSSLSIGYYSPGWPVAAFPNGIVTYIATSCSDIEGDGSPGHDRRWPGGRRDARRIDLRTSTRSGVAEHVLAVPSTGFGIASRLGRQSATDPAVAVDDSSACRRRAGDSDHRDGRVVWVGAVGARSDVNPGLRPPAWPLVAQRPGARSSRG